MRQLIAHPILVGIHKGEATIEPTPGAVKTNAPAPHAHVLKEQLDAIGQAADPISRAVQGSERCDKAEGKRVEVNDGLAWEVKLDGLARPDDLLPRLGLQPDGGGCEVGEAGR
jgi:hypothetical protein